MQNLSGLLQRDAAFVSMMRRSAKIPVHGGRF
jgi:hypothetical protein